MGQFFGILAKSNGVLIKEIPLKAEEESHYSLANIFLNPKIYIENILSESEIDQNRKEWLKLTDDETRSLIYNNIQDFANDEIEYRKSVSEPLKNNFHAIGMVYDETKKEIIYSTKYKALENWSKPNHLSSALYKIKEVLFEDLRVAVTSKKEIDDIKYSYDNIHILSGIVNTMIKLSNIDQAALVYGPY